LSAAIISDKETFESFYRDSTDKVDKEDASLSLIPYHIRFLNSIT